MRLLVLGRVGDQDEILCSSFDSFGKPISTVEREVAVGSGGWGGRVQDEV